MVRPKVAVIGDVMLDIEFRGVARDNFEGARVCVRSGFPSYYPGGAANVAALLNLLGCNVSLYGAVGSDWAAEELEYLLRGVDSILVPTASITTTKTRVYTEEECYRFDSESYSSVGVVNALIDEIEYDGNSYDMVVFSDYGKGVLDGDNVEQLMGMLSEEGTSMIVDPHMESRRDIWSGCILATPNRFEYNSWARNIGTEYVVRTNGAEGATLICPGGDECAIGVELKYETEAPQVVGAGDALVAGICAKLTQAIEFDRSAMLDALTCGVSVASQYVNVPRDEVSDILIERGSVI